MSVATCPVKELKTGEIMKSTKLILLLLTLFMLACEAEPDPYDSMPFCGEVEASVSQFNYMCEEIEDVSVESLKSNHCLERAQKIQSVAGKDCKRDEFEDGFTFEASSISKEDWGKKISKIKKKLNLSSEEPSPSQGGSRNETCKAVDAGDFLYKVDGSWEYDGMGSTCSSSDSGVYKFYLNFNKYSSVFSTYRRMFENTTLGILECTRGGFDEGGRKEVISEYKVELCQTPSLVKQFGSNTYFMKEDGFYRAVSYKVESGGEVILLYSHSISNTTSFDSDLNFYQYRNNRD